MKCEIIISDTRNAVKAAKEGKEGKGGKNKEAKAGKENKEKDLLQYATVQVPAVLPRILELPESENRRVIFLEEIIRHHASPVACVTLTVEGEKIKITCQ